MELNSHELDEIHKFMYSNFGIQLSSKKKTLIESRLSSTLITKGFNSYSDYLAFVKSDSSGKEATHLLNKLTTNHTYFLREKDHFDFFEETLLPELFEANKSTKDICIWSAGCSSGQEAYTIAMYLLDFKSKHPIYSDYNTQVLATDISEKALTKGVKGIYSVDEVNIPPVWINKYFNKLSSKEYQVNDLLKEQVIFRKFNLMTKLYPFKKDFHIIFCRNVMIYFDKNSKQFVLDRYYNHLHKDGHLFIGQSEFIDRASTDFNYVLPSVYKK